MSGGAAVSIFGEYAPRPTFRTVKRMLLCEFVMSDGSRCGAEFSYKHGRPPTCCPDHRGAKGQAARDTHRDRRRQIGAADRAIAIRAAQLQPRDVVAFITRVGVASLAFKLGHKVFVGERMFEGETIELAVAAALEAEAA